MRGLAAGVLMAFVTLSTLPAYAQNPAQEAIDQQKKAAAQDAEKAYQRALKDTASSTPATKADPWGNVRAADPSPTKQNQPPK
jgi:hypothetical protein